MPCSRPWRGVYPPRKDPRPMKSLLKLILCQDDLWNHLSIKLRKNDVIVQLLTRRSWKKSPQAISSSMGDSVTWTGHGSLHKVLMDQKRSFFLTFVIVFSLWTFYNKRYVYFIISQEKKSYVDRETSSDINPENIFSSVAPEISREMDFPFRDKRKFEHYKAKVDHNKHAWFFL